MRLIKQQQKNVLLTYVTHKEPSIGHLCLLQVQRPVGEDLVAVAGENVPKVM